MHMLRPVRPQVSSLVTFGQPFHTVEEGEHAFRLSPVVREAVTEARTPRVALAPREWLSILLVVGHFNLALRDYGWNCKRDTGSSGCPFEPILSSTK